MKLSTSSLIQSALLAAYYIPVTAASDSESLAPCVARSPTTGLYYDLSAISLTPPESKDGEKTHKGGPESWHARGHDYPSNFTINICAPVVEELKDVVGVEKARWKNVSAYYELDGEVYSVGCVSCYKYMEGERRLMMTDNKHPTPSSAAENWSSITLMARPAPVIPILQTLIPEPSPPSCPFSAIATPTPLKRLYPTLVQWMSAHIFSKSGAQLHVEAWPRARMARD